MGDEVTEDAAFEAVIVDGGQRLGCTETCGSGDDGSGDDVLAKVDEFGVVWRDEEKSLQRLMTTLCPLFLRSRNLSRESLFSSRCFRVKLWDIKTFRVDPLS